MKIKHSKPAQSTQLAAPRPLSPTEQRQIAGGAFPFIQSAAVKTEVMPRLAFPFIQT
jgi:hypothetical protein